MRRLLPPSGTDGVAHFEESDVPPPFEAEESREDPVGMDVD
jgi:hypothetical protein